MSFKGAACSLDMYRCTWMSIYIVHTVKGRQYSVYMHICLVKGRQCSTVDLYQL